MSSLLCIVSRKSQKTILTKSFFQKLGDQIRWYFSKSTFDDVTLVDVAICITECDLTKIPPVLLLALPPRHFNHPGILRDVDLAL